MAHLFFFSYARLNATYPEDAELIRKFFKDLEASVQQALGVNYPAFLDTTNIETGNDWNEDLSGAAATSPVATALYSPSYFVSKFCGREFQVFLDRHRKLAPQPGEKRAPPIVPIIWIKTISMPGVATSIQYADATF